MYMYVEAPNAPATAQMKPVVIISCHKIVSILTQRTVNCSSIFVLLHAAIDTPQIPFVQ